MLRKRWFQDGGVSWSLLAGYVAHSMGLPIKMVAAVTPNDIVHRTLQVVWQAGYLDLRIKWWQLEKVIL